ncbi:MAG: PadR family transcriptional regulator [Kofleriaceae bacterium]
MGRGPGGGAGFGGWGGGGGHGGGFPGRPWGPLAGAWFGRGPRARRGNVRAAILALLAEQPRNGYQIMQELENRSRGQWRPSSGSIYPTLQQLEDEGLAEPEPAAAGQGSRTYRLTAEGKTYVATHREEIEPATEEAGWEADPRIELMMLFRQAGSAAMQVAQTGSTKQVDEAKRLLVELRRQLYGILAAAGDDDV